MLVVQGTRDVVLLYPMARLHRVATLSPSLPLVHPLLAFTHPRLAVSLQGLALSGQHGDVSCRLGEIFIELFDCLLEGTVLLDEVVYMR